MATRLKAKVKPEVLVWARESSGFTREKAATALKIGADVLTKWELGEDAPSIPKLRKLAGLYKRPLAVMYLSAPPMRFQAMRDFRRLAGSSMAEISPAIVIEERRARQRRELSLELASDLEEEVPAFEMAASMAEAPEAVAERVRAELGVTADVQRSWRDSSGRRAFQGWRERIESKGVLVFQSDKFSADEASGFAVWEPVSPIIVISRKGTPQRRRTFSLLHEFAHLLVRASGVSDLDIDSDTTRPPEELRIEVFCNAVAGAVLVPNADLLAYPTVLNHPRIDLEWTDDELREIGRTFGVSREVVLRRLLVNRRTSTQFYREARARFAEEWEAFRLQQKAQKKPGGIPRNVPRETLGNLGRPFVGMVLQQYHQDRLSLSEAVGYLDLKSKHIPKIEQMIRGGA